MPLAAPYYDIDGGFCLINGGAEIVTACGGSRHLRNLCDKVSGLGEVRSNLKRILFPLVAKCQSVSVASTKAAPTFPFDLGRCASQTWEPHPKMVSIKQLPCELCVCDMSSTNAPHSRISLPLVVGGPTRASGAVSLPGLVEAPCSWSLSLRLLFALGNAVA